MTSTREEDLRVSQNQENLLRGITNRIRMTLELQDILIATVGEVRSFLGTDRVMIYKFHVDSSGQVIAESINDRSLPSLLGLNFPASDIPPHARELFIKSRVRSLVNVNEGKIGQSPVCYPQTKEIISEDFRYRPVDSCHVEYLTAMGVQSSLVVPILVDEKLWGLLVSHHSQPRSVGEDELQVLQIVVDQLEIAIAHSTLLTQAREKAEREAIVSRIATLLHSLPTIVLQPALEAAIVAFGGSGGRLCIRNEAFNYQNRSFRSFPECLIPGFDSNWGGEFVGDFEAASPNWLNDEYKLGINTVWNDTYLQDTQAGRYRNNETFAVDDIYKMGFTQCHIDNLEQFQIHAFVLAPIFVGHKLWGLLTTYQHSGSRQWQDFEVNFFSQIAAQIGVALQQAELLAQTKHQAEQLAQALEELQQTQAQLIQTEKMSSLGQLVAGVAHEINNPINFIYANLSPVFEYAKGLLSMLALYQQQYPNPSREICDLAKGVDLEFIAEDLPKILSSLKVGSDRIRLIVLSLRNFSRLDEAQMKQVDIHEGIDSTLLILQHRLKAAPNSRGVEVVKEYDKLPLVECYAGQLNQVFMNVLSNAIDALEQSLEKKPGEISDRPQIRIITEVINNDQVVIRIADNGSGIPEDIKTRIFDPFFTTKPVGKGTGLGLSISYQIVVNKHGGVFKCNSQPKSGTEFWIQIPITCKV